MKFRVLIIDDDKESIETTVDYLKGEIDDQSLVIESATTFDNGKIKLSEAAYDLVILDLKNDSTDDPEAGERLFEETKYNQLIPVIIYSGRATDSGRSVVIPWLQKINKDDTDGLVDAVKTVMNSVLVKEVKNFCRTISSEISRFVWDGLYISEEKFLDSVVNEEWLRDILNSRFVSYLGSKLLDADTVDPSRLYLFPAVGDNYLPGDVFCKPDTTVEQWYVLVTPACDLVDRGKKGRKAKMLTFLKGMQVEKVNEYSDHDSSKNKRDAFVRYLKSERRFYLPKFREVPHLVFELDDVELVKFDQINSLTRVASLCSPYGEALLAKRAAFVGRIGTPDLDLDKLFPVRGS